MFEIGPQHPSSYRQEVVQPLFDCISASESCYVVGSASMGKSRLLEHLGRRQIQETYLGEEAVKSLLVRADCNRAREITEWGLYELMLTSIIDACIDYSIEGDYYRQFNEWRMVVLRSKDPTIALRQLELAVRLLVRMADLRLCFLLDEFDEFYRKLPSQAMGNLRALRDANKYRLCYVLFLRNIPTYLRVPEEAEGFYELFSRSALGLKPYSIDDAIRMVEQIRQRRGYTIPAVARDRLLLLSGGCPGLIVALLDVAMEDAALITDEKRLAQLVNRPRVIDECRKIWEGLPEEEQRGLVNILKDNTVPADIRMSLELKGMIRTQDGVRKLLSPLFAGYVRTVS